MATTPYSPQASGALGALNAAVEVLNLDGSAGFYLEAGTLVGTLVVEGSPYASGDASWGTVVFFAGGQWRSTYPVTAATGIQIISVSGQAGIHRYRLRVSAYTSGTQLAWARRSPTQDALGLAPTVGFPSLGAPLFTTQVGGVDSGGAIRTIQVVSAFPVGGEQGIVVTPARSPVYNYLIPSQVHVASANTVHWDLFNAHATLVVRVLSIKQIPNITTAVTGIVFDWLLERTTSAGTGGTALTAWLADLSQTALNASITARSKPTGAAAQSTDLFTYSLSSEETNAATIQIASQGGLELVPEAMRPINGGQGIVLRQNQGIRCVQITSSIEGNTSWLISFQATT